MMKKLMMFSSIFILLFVCAGSTSRAALIFSDNFDSYTPGIPWLTWAGTNWSVSDGSVDLIGEGTSWNLIPGHGLYVDMDGSTNDAGKITSILISMNPGDYILSYDVAGNQRDGGDDSVIVQVGGGSLVDTTTTAGQNAPFTTISIPFTIGTAIAASISFDGVGSDNVGLLLDNVAINSVENIIPAPGAILLGSIGISLVGLLRRRGKL
jgi:hypothetical protein